MASPPEGLVREPQVESRVGSSRPLKSPGSEVGQGEAVSPAGGSKGRVRVSAHKRLGLGMFPADPRQMACAARCQALPGARPPQHLRPSSPPPRRAPGACPPGPRALPPRLQALTTPFPPSPTSLVHLTLLDKTLLRPDPGALTVLL